MRFAIVRLCRMRRQNSGELEQPNQLQENIGLPIRGGRNEEIYLASLHQGVHPLEDDR